MKSLTKRDLISVAIFLVFLLVIIKFISVISSIIITLIVALVFSAIIDGPVSFLERKRVHRTVSTLFCIIILLGLTVGTFNLIIPNAVKEFKSISTEFPTFKNKFESSVGNLLKKVNINYDTLKESEQIKTKINEAIPFVVGGVTKAGMSTLNMLVSGFLVVVLCIYIVSDPRPLIKGFLDPWDNKTRKRLRRCMIRIQKMLFSWAIGLCVGMFCIFILTWIGLLIIGFDAAFLFAVVAGFLNVIPTLGPILAAIPPVLITLLSNPMQVIWVLLIYIIVQQIESNIVTPMIMKKQLKLHPLVLLLSIIVMGTFFGIVGCFITAPLIASLSIVYDEFYAIPRKYKDYLKGNQF